MSDPVSHHRSSLDATLAALKTETPSPQTTNLDLLSVDELLTVMNDADQAVPAMVREVIPDISRAVTAITARCARGGRLIYVGAGTAGRLGVLDASEIPPTFGVEPNTVVGLLAGGQSALTSAVENAEDDADAGAEALRAIGLVPEDVVVGISASGRTPYARGALVFAETVGALTIALTCNRPSELGCVADIAIEVEAGPEILTGSTRLKAGTVQKLVLNMISTALMVQQGRVYGNLMVDLRATNAKLASRAARIVAQILDTSLSEAQAFLVQAHGNVPVAVLMARAGLNFSDAQRVLAEHGGRLREAVDALSADACVLVSDDRARIDR